MLESISARLKALARRAGFAGVPTSVLVAGMFLLTVAVVLALVRWWPHPADAGTLVEAGHSASAPASGAATGSDAESNKKDASGDTSLDGTATVFVDVVGAVRHPGVYSLLDGSRIQAAVEAAGGLTPEAAAAAVNLAAKTQDGEQIIVPTQAQVDKGEIPVGASGAGPAGGGSGGTAGGIGRIGRGGFGEPCGEGQLEHSRCRGARRASWCWSVDRSKDRG